MIKEKSIKIYKLGIGPDGQFYNPKYSQENFIIIETDLIEFSEYKELKKREAKFKEREAKLVEALRFYAEQNNWLTNDLEKRSFTEISQSDIEKIENERLIVISVHGGKRARQALKDLDYE